MATVIELPIVAPPLPKSWKASGSSTARISPLVQRTLLPSGPAFLSHVHRTQQDLSFEAYDRYLESVRQDKKRSAGDDVLGEEDDLGVGDEVETQELLSLDPKEWKKQDHYAVLGLSHLRYKATLDQIKIAHRKKVLKHHPDKKAGLAGHTANDDAFFKCIQKAYEVLTSTTRRPQFDSVDPYYQALEDNAPTASDFKKRAPAAAAQQAAADEKRFFAAFAPVFEREARFSRVVPVPMLGTIDAPKEDVEAFYDFWYNFDSWRSFEYLDKEVNEGSDNRDDKRYTEKKNKSERARRKKEDTARLRSVVDLTLSLDPRIKRIKQEDKAAREAKKRNKVSGSGASTPVNKVDEEEKRKEEERKLEQEKIAKAEAKKAKAAAANAAKKARRLQRAAEEAVGSSQ